MNSKSQMSKQNAADAVHGTLATSVWASYLAGWSINEWAAFAALVYSLVLIADKLGVLAPMRSCIVALWRWAWGRAVAYWRAVCR